MKSIIKRKRSLLICVLIITILLITTYIVLADQSSVNLSCTTSQGASTVFTVYPSGGGSASYTSTFQSSGSVQNPAVLATKTGTCSGSSCQITHYTTAPGQGKAWRRSLISVSSPSTHTRQSTGCRLYTILCFDCFQTTSIAIDVK